MADDGYVAVTNIPAHFRAADLRAHFSALVESNSFVCFHFRHRPEKVSETVNDEGKNSKPNYTGLKRCCCCVARVLKSKLYEVLRYDGQHWVDVQGSYLADQCRVSHIKLKVNGENDDDCGTVEEEKLLQMPELNPPELMPNGNVGTPTLVFLDFIQRCLLPHNLIKKLHLTFPRTAAKRFYGNVDFDYEIPDSQKLKNQSINSHHSCSSDSEWLSNSQHSFRESDAGKRKVNGVVDKDASLKPDIHSSNHEHLMLDGNSSSLHSRQAYLQSANIDSKKLEMFVQSGTKQSVGSCSETIGSCLESIGSCSEFVGSCSESVGSCSALSTSSCTKNSSLISTTQHLPQENVNKFQGSSDGFIVPAALPAQRRTLKLTNREKKHLKREENHRIRTLRAENIEERFIAIDRRYHNDDDAEEWDRHEASEDDPSNQERNKERLYDEEIEQPWEKGGPGVVFYTDAMVWQEREGDFDEQTTDDLDVDFSAYEEPGAGDKDIQDFLKIRQERRFRDGYDDTDRFSIGIAKQLQKSSSSRSNIGTFECHSKGIGRKLMEKQGWEEGQGLGKSLSGIVHALKGEGQNPRSKRGLGYTDVEPILYSVNRQKKSRNEPHLITSRYDDPKITDPKEQLLTRSEPSTLKHRQSHFEHFS